MRRRLIEALALGVAMLALLLGGASSARAGFIVNGSFETPYVGPLSQYAPYDYNQFPNGGVPGWTSNNNETEIDYTPQAIGYPAYDGSQSLELNGSTFDTISQTVTGLVPGQTYQLSWAYGVRALYGPQQTNIIFGGVTVATDSTNGFGTPGWTLNTVDVTATATSEVLSFQAVDTSGLGGSPGGGNEIDAVSLVPAATAVPEPASLTLLGIGALGLLGYGWRRRRQAVA